MLASLEKHVLHDVRRIDPPAESRVEAKGHEPSEPLLMLAQQLAPRRLIKSGVHRVKFRRRFVRHVE